MSGFDRQRLVAALLLAATALYLLAVAPRMRYRRAVRAVALTVYAVAFGVVLIWVALWAMGIERPS